MPKRKTQAPLTDDGAAKTLGFRLDPHHFALLEERAKLSGMSTGDLARIMVLDTLNQQSQIALLRERILALEGNIDRVRRHVALSTAALLSPRQNLTKEQALEYVRLHFGPV